MTVFDYPDTIQRIVEQGKNEFKGETLAISSNSSDYGGIGMNISFTDYTYDAAMKPARRGSNVISLPLPLQLQQATGIKIGENELGSGGALAADIFSNNVSEKELQSALSKSGVTDNLNVSEAGSLVAKTAEAIKYFSRSAIDSTFTGAGLAADVINGTAVNPHATLNFDGVNLKQYVFNWQFAPRNEGESERIRDIISRINRNIHPQYEQVLGGSSSLNRALLKYPSLVTVNLRGLSRDFYPIFRYPMMASNFEVDYSPQGNSMVEGNKPAFVNMTLQLQETKIRTREDF